MARMKGDGWCLDIPNGHFGDSYAEKVFGVAQADIWVTFDMKFKSAFVTQLAADVGINDGPNILRSWTNDAIQQTSEVLYFVYDGGGASLKFRYQTSPSSLGPLSADTWHTVEVHLTTGNPHTGRVFVDGVDLGATTLDSGDEATWFSGSTWKGIWLGAFYYVPSSGCDDNFEVRFDNVKVGTSQGASDIFSDDFEGGDFGAWTSSSPAASVETDTDIIGPDDPGPDTPANIYAKGFRWICGQAQNDTVLKDPSINPSWAAAGFFVGVWGVTYHQDNFARDGAALAAQANAVGADFLIIDAEFCLYYADDAKVDLLIAGLNDFAGPKALTSFGAPCGPFTFPINFQKFIDAGFDILPQAYYSATSTADGQSSCYRPDLVMAYYDRIGLPRGSVHPMIDMCSDGHPDKDEQLALLTDAGARSDFSVFMVECCTTADLDTLGDVTSDASPFSFGLPGLMTDNGGGISVGPGGPGTPGEDPFPGFPDEGEGPLPQPGEQGYPGYIPPGEGADEDAGEDGGYSDFNPDAMVPPSDSGLPNLHFFEMPLARFVVTNLAGETVTFLEKRALRAEATHTLNAPFELSIEAPSDHPEVNLNADVLDPDQPFIDEGVNMIYWFLRWGNTLSSSRGPWQCHGAGLIMNVSDRGDDGNPVSTFTAWDPWKLLYRRPVLDEDGLILDPIHFPTSDRASDIAKTLLQRSVTYFGESHIIINDAWIEDTEPLTEGMDFQHGTSVGEAWDQLVETGTIDIYLKPIYDPINHPGKLCELHIYSRKGAYRPGAVFSWDRWPRSVMELERVQDGTARANKVQYYAGQGGPPALVQESPDSELKYGTYYEQQFFPAQATEAVVAQMAARELRLRKDGQFDYTLTPAGERAPWPFKQYALGDTVPVWASKRFRRVIEDTRLRVQKIPMLMEGDQLMRVTNLMVVVDDAIPGT